MFVLVLLHRKSWYDLIDERSLTTSSETEWLGPPNQRLLPVASLRKSPGVIFPLVRLTGASVARLGLDLGKTTSKRSETGRRMSKILVVLAIKGDKDDPKMLGEGRSACAVGGNVSKSWV